MDFTNMRQQMEIGNVTPGDWVALEGLCVMRVACPKEWDASLVWVVDSWGNYHSTSPNTEVVWFIGASATV